MEKKGVKCSDCGPRDDPAVVGGGHHLPAGGAEGQADDAAAVGAADVGQVALAVAPDLRGEWGNVYKVIVS